MSFRPLKIKNNTLLLSLEKPCTLINILRLGWGKQIHPLMSMAMYGQTLCYFCGIVTSVTSCWFSVCLNKSYGNVLLGHPGGAGMERSRERPFTLLHLVKKAFLAKSGIIKTVFVGITCVSQLWQFCFLLSFSPGQSS